MTGCSIFSARFYKNSVKFNPFFIIGRTNPVFESAFLILSGIQYMEEVGSKDSKGRL